VFQDVLGWDTNNVRDALRDADVMTSPVVSVRLCGWQAFFAAYEAVVPHRSHSDVLDSLCVSLCL
jgi:hypothetical protein